MFGAGSSHNGALLSCVMQPLSLPEGHLIPFGALVWYKEREAGTFAPKGEPALYLGPEVIDGMRFKGAHQVGTLRSLKDGGFRVVITKDLAVPNGKWSFPLAKAKALDEDTSSQASQH